MEMLKLLFTIHIGLLIILTTLDEANGIPIRLLPRTQYTVTTPEIKVTETLKWSVKQKMTGKFKMDPRKNKFKIDRRLNIVTGTEHTQQVGDKITETANNTSYQKTTVAVLPMKKDVRKFVGMSPKMAVGVRAYYPNTQLETVCYDQSTIYNKPVVKTWLRTEINDNWGSWANVRNRRVYFMGLRKQLYLQGRSEECHTRKMNKVRSYLECSLLRNQRLEYMIPMYPLHQVFFHFLTTKIESYIYH